jgi:two-component system, NtrC family, sensor kinase
MKHPNLQNKLIARLLFVLLSLGLLFVISLNYYMRSLMETEVADKARLIFSGLLAVQTYARETLRPVIQGVLSPESFVMEAMSTSYITRKVMSDLNMARDQFAYRRVAMAPRNPEFAANELEREFIRHFQHMPTDQVLSRFRVINDEENYVIARPVVFEKRCLVCHGIPEDAPAVMLARYGSERGFGRKEGEISGLDMLMVPIERERSAIRRATITFALIFACGTICILGFNHLFFDRVTIQNVSRLAAVLRSRFPVEANDTLPERPRKGDEIEGMVADVERFADYLRAAKEQLSDYAANLEAKVESRTAELRRESEARISDVQLFLDMLELFTETPDRGNLLDRALAAVAARFGAETVAFHCFFSMNQYTWPHNSNSFGLESASRDRLLEGTGSFRPGEAVVPVQTADSIRGALALRWKEPLELPPRERDVFMAVGRQLGIEFENLEAMENILQRKTLLESIFEGIADPLFLLDSSGSVAHANEAASRLTTRLAENGEDPASFLAFADLSAEAVHGNGHVVQREVLLPDGRSLTIRSYPIGALRGVGRTIVYARDNTLERTMLARMQQTEKSLAVGKLAAGLAHEINNPLGVILCYARLLWDNGKSEHADDLGIIIRHTLEAQKVLQDLLRFARSKPDLMTALRLADTVEFISRVFQVRAAKNGITIVPKVPPDLPTIMGDPRALEQVLSNIVINSIDSLEEGLDGKSGRIDISGCHDKATGCVILTISDNGPGIPEENLSRVFDPFFTTKAVGKGTGLGLSIVYGLVRDLGGRIEVENRDGAVFTLYFPNSEGTQCLNV